MKGHGVAFSDETYSIDLLKHRDAAAWESFYDSLSADLRSFARRIGSVDPDDIVGEAMLNIVRDIDTFEGRTEELRPWAFRIVRNRVIDSARRRKTRPQEVEMDEAKEVGFSISDPHGDVDLSLLASALELLTPEQREVLWLRYALDFSLDTTADIMGSSPDAVASMAYRALSRLRTSL